jgi:Lytic transglycolase
MPLATILMAFVCIWLSSIVAEAWPPRPGQVGCASWCGAGHHGRPTAIRERFPMYRLTAAHRTLPLGTTAVVTHLRTRRQVMVRISDRGLYVHLRRRVIDLSQAATRRLGFEFWPCACARRGAEGHSPVDTRGSHIILAPRPAGRERRVLSLHWCVALRTCGPYGGLGPCCQEDWHDATDAWEPLLALHRDGHIAKCHLAILYI